MTDPIDSVYVDGVDVDKASERSYEAARSPLVLTSASDITSLTLLRTHVIYNGQIFQYDATDTTSAHDGVTVFVSANDRRYKVSDVYVDSVYIGGKAASNALDAFVNKTTWVPAIAFSGGTTGVTYSYQYGTYIRIGDIFEAFFDIQMSNKGSSTGAAQLTGLPFTIGAATGRGDIQTSYATGFSGLTGGVIGRVEAGQTIGYISNWNGGNVTDLTDANFTNATRFQGMVRGFIV